MNPIKELKTEHRAIESALKILGIISNEIASPKEEDAAADAALLVDFFRTFADTCHHGKEEGFLFPVLEQIGISRQGGPIGVMLSEHDQGRMHIREMLEALAQIRAGDKDAAKTFQKAALAYIELLHHHIYKEDHVLFEIASQRLSKVRIQWLAENFDRLEREKIGPGRHEELHVLLDSLEEKYLPGREPAASGSAEGPVQGKPENCGAESA